MQHEAKQASYAWIEQKKSSLTHTHPLKNPPPIYPSPVEPSKCVSVTSDASPSFRAINLVSNLHPENDADIVEFF